MANETTQGGSTTIDNTQQNVNEPSAKSPSRPDKHHGHGCGCPKPAPWSPGGELEQSNKADNKATVDNSNETIQAAGQVQAAEATATGGDAGQGSR